MTMLNVEGEAAAPAAVEEASEGGNENDRTVMLDAGVQGLLDEMEDEDDEFDFFTEMEFEFEPMMSEEEIAALPPTMPKGIIVDGSKKWENLQSVKANAEKWQRHDSDCGSSEVQVARLTARIVYMTEHCIKNKKDKHSRRGLIAMVNRRRKLLNYLFENKPEVCEELVKDLQIRFKDPKAKMVNKTEKYSRFPQAKPRKVTQKKYARR